MKGQEDVQTEGGARPQDGQQGTFQSKDERTYTLREEPGRKRVGSLHFGEKTRGPTY